ncbi:PIN domain-like family protein [Wolffia australiana]
MRVKKQKRNRRTVKFFSACFGFREPFKVICDGTFIHHLLAHRLLPADDALAKLLGARVTLFSSRCITAELKSLGQSHSESLEASLQLIPASCDHEKRVNAAACIESIIAEGNGKHFFVATQDIELRRRLREVPSVPVIYGLKNSLLIEQPSTAQREFVKCSEEKRLHASVSEIQILRKEVNETDQGRDSFDPDQSSRTRTLKRSLDSTEKSKFKRKRAKGPNPLSCKKKKSKEVSIPSPNKEGSVPAKKRKRTRKKKDSGLEQGSGS